MLGWLLIQESANIRIAVSLDHTHNGRLFMQVGNFFADLKLSMLGRHQLDNAAAAVAAANVLREQGLGRITHETVIQGLQQTSLPGRLQVRHLA